MPLNCDSHHGGICQQSPTDFAFSVGLGGVDLVDIVVSPKGHPGEGKPNLR
jgi:hypothetical protein